MKYNVYCDESCHLEHDNSSVMILGAMYCPEDIKTKIYNDIRQIKLNNQLNSHFEIKWTKVSASKIDFYLELLEYYWSVPELKYRCLVATHKNQLDHGRYNSGDYDLWYYKMYYYLLNGILEAANEYHVMLDIKDTHGGKRVEKLREVICNGVYDFNQHRLDGIGLINSKESEILQIADLINGAIGFHHRRLDQLENSNGGKKLFVKALQEKHDIDNTTYGARNSKFDMFVWQPRN